MMITTQHIIDTNKKAYEDKTLGLFHHDYCAYDYEDGSRCSIGWVLTKDQLDELWQKDAIGCSVYDLYEYLGIKFEDRELAHATQIIHDTCAEGSQLVNLGLIAQSLTKELSDFIMTLRGVHLKPEHFKMWLDKLEEVYPS